MADVRARLREAHPPVTRLKLYNAGSFFDERAIPSSDYDAVADLLRDFDHVVVESHPALIGVRVDRLQNALARTAGQRHAVTGRRPALEVAMGLETAHPAALAALNKAKDKSIQAVAKKLDALLVWPGKPGVVLPVIKPLTAAEQQRFEMGKVMFEATCAACHQPHGYGQDGLAPPLVDSEWVAGSPELALLASGSEVFLALDAADGHQLWTRSAPAALTRE